MDNVDLETRIARLEAAVAVLQARLPEKRSEPHPAPAPLVKSLPQEDVLRRLGRSVLIVGGAYVLRALTETAVISEMTGVLLGLLYALFWIWRNQSATATVIAGALIWEATARFEILNASAAAALALIVALTLMLHALRERSVREAMLAAAMVGVTCIGVAVMTQDVVPPLLAIAAAGVALSWVTIFLDTPPLVTLGLGFATDMLALVTAVLAPRGVVPALLAVVVMWIATPLVLRLLKRERDVRWPELVQAAAVVFFGLGAAVWVTRSPVVIATCFAIGIAAYGAVFARASADRGTVATALAAGGAIAIAYGTFGTLLPSMLALTWGAIGFATAVAGGRWKWDAMNVQSALWAVASLIAAGMAQPLPLVAVCALALLSLWWGSREAHACRLALLAVVTSSAFLITMSVALRFMEAPGTIAVTRSLLIALAAVLLYALTPLVPEAKTIARALLVIGGIKLIVEDLRVSPAMLIVIALAAYGGALSFAASRRSTPSPTANQATPN